MTRTATQTQHHRQQTRKGARHLFACRKWLKHTEKRDDILNSPLEITSLLPLFDVFPIEMRYCGGTQLFWANGMPVGHQRTNLLKRYFRPFLCLGAVWHIKKVTEFHPYIFVQFILGQKKYNEARAAEHIQPGDQQWHRHNNLKPNKSSLKLNSCHESMWFFFQLHRR